MVDMAILAMRQLSTYQEGWMATTALFRGREILTNMLYMQPMMPIYKYTNVWKKHCYSVTNPVKLSLCFNKFWSCTNTLWTSCTVYWDQIQLHITVPYLNTCFSTFTVTWRCSSNRSNWCCLEIPPTLGKERAQIVIIVDYCLQVAKQVQHINTLQDDTKIKYWS